MNFRTRVSLDCRHVFRGCSGPVWCGASSGAERPTTVSGKAGGEDLGPQCLEPRLLLCSPCPFPGPAVWSCFGNHFLGFSCIILLPESHKQAGQLLPSGGSVAELCVPSVPGDNSLGVVQNHQRFSVVWEPRQPLLAHCWSPEHHHARACSAGFIVTGESVTGLSMKEIHLVSCLCLRTFLVASNKMSLK